MAMGTQAVVIDNGTISTKVGFEGEDSPLAVFPSVVGRRRHTGVWVGMGGKDAYVGDEALTKRGLLSFRPHTENGVVKNWDSMEKIWQYSFTDKLYVSPEELPILLTEPPLNPRPNREKLTNIIFETFNVPGMYLANQAILSLYSSGRTNGIVLDVGEDASYIVPIYDGYTVPQAISKLNLGGRDVTWQLGRLYHETCILGKTENYSVYKETLQDIKEKLGYVALDYEQELEIARINPSLVQAEYNFPSGEVIIVGSGRFRCPEVLFQPSLLGLEDDGIHKALNESMRKCDSSIRKCLSKSILPTGGSIFFPGFVERLRKEIKGYDSLWEDVNIVSLPGVEYSSWIGGSILASLTTFEKMLITKAEYLEYGPSIVHRKCF